jgi:hypothetical protein
MLAPSKNRRFKTAFLEQRTNQAWGTNDESKAVRCESTALYRVCQARTTTSSSLNAYPPTSASKPDKRLWRTAGNPYPRGFASGTRHGGRWPLDRPILNSGYAREGHRTRHVGVRMGLELWNSWISSHFLVAIQLHQAADLLQWSSFFPETLAGTPESSSRSNPGLKSETWATHSKFGVCSFVDPKGVLGSRRGFDLCTDPAQARESRSCP